MLEKFKRVVKFSFAAKICLVLFVFFSLLHLGVIFGILLFNFVPLDFLWGGQMKTKEDLLVFEIISLIVQLLCLWILVLKIKLVRIEKANLAIDIVIWILAFVFFVNTIGNLMAKTLLERYLATPVTAILSILLIRIGIEKKFDQSKD